MIYIVSTWSHCTQIKKGYRIIKHARWRTIHFKNRAERHGYKEQTVFLSVSLTVESTDGCTSHWIRKEASPLLRDAHISLLVNMRKPSRVSGETYVTPPTHTHTQSQNSFLFLNSVSPKNTSHFKMWLLVLATVSCCFKGVLSCRSSPMLWSEVALRLVSSVRHSHIQLMSVWCSETLTHSTTSHLEMAINSKMFQGHWSFLVVLSVSAPCLMHVHKVREKGSRSYIVWMFTRHLSKSFFTSIAGHSAASTLDFQPVALNCESPKRCSSKMMGYHSFSLFFVLEKWQFWFLSLRSCPLYTFLNVRLSLRGVSVVQLFTPL